MNPMRTGLTTLGIVIGVGTVILVLSAGAGFKAFVNSQVDALGTNSIIIETKVPPTSKSKSSAATTDLERAASTVTITTLKNRDINDIKRIPNVANAYGAVFGMKTASYQNVVKNSLVLGVTSERFDIDKTKFAAGRAFTVQEDAGAAQVAILGAKISETLFGQDDPIGKTVRVGDLNFEVIGVYEKKGSFGGFDEDNAVMMPLNTAQKKLLGIDYLVIIIAQAQNPDISDATAEDIRLQLRQNHDIKDPVKDDFSVTTAAEGMAIFDTIFSGISFLLIAIAAISLVVGGVGIMNIMYVIVTERISEIGLKKALGARYKDILSEFLIEAILITLLGGAVGIILGAALSFLLSVIAKQTLSDWKFVVPMSAIIVGVGVSGTIGLIFGVLPARKAAKMDPIEALRYE
ncbi:MAG: ABC transporter permease [Candidatus Saccharibacteria bacterium]